MEPEEPTPEQEPQEPTPEERVQHCSAEVAMVLKRHRCRLVAGIIRTTNVGEESQVLQTLACSIVPSDTPRPRPR